MAAEGFDATLLPPTIQEEDAADGAGSYSAERASLGLGDKANSVVPAANSMRSIFHQSPTNAPASAPNANANQKQKLHRAQIQYSVLAPRAVLGQQRQVNNVAGRG